MNSLERLLWWLIAGSRGGQNRARILMLLKERPMNTHQLAKAMSVDYSTIQHHLKVLKKNGFVGAVGGKYGALYFLAAILEENWDTFLKIEERIGKNKISDEKDGGEDE